MSRYENKRILVNAYFDQLFALQSVTRKSVGDLKELISMVREAPGGLQSLGAPIKSWNYFIVYFIM